MKKPFPKLDSDVDSETFLDTAELEEYDLAVGALPRDEWFARYERFIKNRSETQRLVCEDIERGLSAPSRNAPPKD